MRIEFVHARLCLVASCSCSETQNEEAAMLASILIRLGGVAAMVGGVASATLGVLTVLVLGLKYEIPGSIEKTIQKGGWEPRVANMLLIGALAATVALHALQRLRYGSRGTLAALAAFIGLVLLPVGWLVAVAWLVAGPSFTPALITAVLVVGVLAASVGIVSLGIVTMSAGVLPRWCGVALIAGSPPSVGLELVVLAFLGLPAMVPGGIAWALAGVPWVVVGYAIFRSAGRRTDHPARVR
jgi:hypothetical protein